MALWLRCRVTRITESLCQQCTIDASWWVIWLCNLQGHTSTTLSKNHWYTGSAPNLRSKLSRVDKSFRAKQLITRMMESHPVSLHIDGELAYIVPSAIEPTEHKSIQTDSHLIKPFLSTPHIFLSLDEVPLCYVSECCRRRSLHNQCCQYLYFDIVSVSLCHILSIIRDMTISFS